MTFTIIPSIYPEPVVHWHWWLISAETRSRCVGMTAVLTGNPTQSESKSKSRTHTKKLYVATRKKWKAEWLYGCSDKSLETHSEAEFYGLLKIKQTRVLPCFSTSFKGSTPGERMKNMGVAGPDSSKETAKSSDLPITNLLPSFSSTKSLRGENTTQFSSTLFFIIFDRHAE